MYVLTVRIAEHIVRFRTDSAKIREDLHIQCGKSNIRLPAGLEPDLTIDVQEGYGLPFSDYDVEVTGGPDRMAYRRQDYLVETGPGCRTASIRVYDGFALKHAFMNLYSAFITHRRWGLLLHSSCVAENGEAYLFAGHSGAGKSTVARLSFPREILADEAAIVKIGSDETMVFDSPFRSDPEIKGGGGVSSFPLAAIHLLHQALHDRRSKVDKPDAILQVLNKVFYWAHHPDQTIKVLEMCKQLVTRVPVYDLHFQKKETFWREIGERRSSRPAGKNAEALS